MMKELREEQIKLEDMTQSQFTELMLDWKKELIRAGAGEKDTNSLIITVLKKCIKDEENESLKTVMINHLRGVEMKKESVNKTMQIFVLDYETRIEIKELLEQALIEMDFSGNELDQYLEDGLGGQLCDLEETIDIYNLKTVKIN